jgi:CheY-like chemotaxis protein
MTKRSILLADDDAAFLQALALRCRSLGLAVRTASDGAQTLKAVAENAPDLLILDINMPAGNGLDVAEKLLRNPTIPPVPVVFCTGRSDAETLARCAALGAHCVIKDSDVWARLRPAIRRILGLGPDATDEATAPAVARLHEATALPRLLFVDDDADLRRAMQIRLRACEVQAMTAATAQQALWMAVNEAPDVIVTDYWMPEGSGEYLLARLRAVPLLKKIPVLLMTGSAGPLKRDFALERRFLGEYGVSAVLYKPVDFDALLAELSRHIPVNVAVWKAAARMRRR